MKKFLGQKVQDTTWGQYLAMVVAVYAALFAWIYKETLLEKLDNAKEKIPHRKYAKRVEEEEFDE